MHLQTEGETRGIIDLLAKAIKFDINKFLIVLANYNYCDKVLI